MLRKTAIALSAVASVGLVVPTMALARGAGGLLFELCLGTVATVPQFIKTLRSNPTACMWLSRSKH